MKLKAPDHPAHRRAILQSILDQGIDTPSSKSLSSIMKGFKEQGGKPSTGTRDAPRARLIRERPSAAIADLENSFDQMVASALTGGAQTTGVLSSMFGITPNLTGR